MWKSYIRYVAWVWLIVIGALIVFLPHGPILCIVCGGLATTVVGVISAILGIAGLVVGRSEPMPGVR